MRTERRELQGERLSRISSPKRQVQTVLDGPARNPYLLRPQYLALSVSRTTPETDETQTIRRVGSREDECWPSCLGDKAYSDNRKPIGSGTASIIRARPFQDFETVGNVLPPE